MELLKKVNALVLGLAVLLAFGCGGDEPEPDDVTPPVAAVQSCQLTQQEYYDQFSSNILTNNYVYNSQQQLVQVNLAQTFSPNSADKVTFEYNSAGQLIKRTSISNITQYSLFKYNQAGLLESEEQYSPNPFIAGAFSLGDINTFQYNAGNKLIKQQVYYAPDYVNPVKIIDFSYPATNKAFVQTYNVRSGTATLAKTNEITFDNNPRPSKYNVALVITEMISDHNVLKDIENFYNSSGFRTETFESTYKYNAAGYPIEMSSSQDGSTPYVSNRNAYNCQ